MRCIDLAGKRLVESIAGRVVHLTVLFCPGAPAVHPSNRNQLILALILFPPIGWNLAGPHDLQRLADQDVLTRATVPVTRWTLGKTSMYMALAVLPTGVHFTVLAIDASRLLVVIIDNCGRSQFHRNLSPPFVHITKKKKKDLTICPRYCLHHPRIRQPKKLIRVFSLIRRVESDSMLHVFFFFFT